MMGGGAHVMGGGAHEMGDNSCHAQFYKRC